MINNRPSRLLSWKSTTIVASCLLLLISCQPSAQQKERTDELNAKASFYHYRNLDSVSIYADSVFNSVKHDNKSRAQALNHKAFVLITHMQYDKAWQLLDKVNKTTSDRLERAIADIHRMRLCQRQSKNKEFYTYKESASQHLATIKTPQTPREAYAQSEYYIILSTYYYYVGQYEKSREALFQINPYQLKHLDPVQTMSYYYNMGSGGMIESEGADIVANAECNYLLQCYKLALRENVHYFEAQALQSLCEHALASDIQRHRIAKLLFDIDNGDDAKLPRLMAQRSLELFRIYGDVYQVAGAYRTLAQCAWHEGDYHLAIDNLQLALNTNPAIQQAPDLVATIREQLSLAYAALNMKAQSDENRNQYLDLQQYTRQDREMEARADELHEQEQQRNTMILLIGLLILSVVVLFFLFDHLRRRNDRKFYRSHILEPSQQWVQRQADQNQQNHDLLEEMKEQEEIARQRLVTNKQQNLEQRAKVSLVGSMVPLIDRMKKEFDSAQQQNQPLNDEQKQYIAELLQEIDRNNALLTEWIQLQQGQLRLRIETFALQELFSLIDKSRASFSMRDIQLHVHATPTRVKADKTLTLFMLNTMADNARRYTPRGGKVDIRAEETDQYVEVSVTDTGCGIEKDTAEHIFDHNVSNGHGFGLMNCKGIIEKYKKTSQLFSVCHIGVESKKGEGSRFFFRLPKGIQRAIMLLVIGCSTLLPQTLSAVNQQPISRLMKAVYDCNRDGNYEQALQNADSCIQLFNSSSDIMPMRMEAPADIPPAELFWYDHDVAADYPTILDLRNEIAIAAMGLHRWNLYEYNNTAYTTLFRKMSADGGLSQYVKRMSATAVQKNIAIAVLSLLLLILCLSYITLYYLPRRRYLSNIRLVSNLNNILQSEVTVEEKRNQVEKIYSQMQSIRHYQKKNVALITEVKNIVSLLSESAGIAAEQQLQMEIQQDQVTRLQYEGDRLYIANSVIENCLSTLKHETMYFPARIATLLKSEDHNHQDLATMVNYYHALYILLYHNAQTMSEKTYQHMDRIDISPYLQHQEALYIRGDKDMIHLLFTILHKQLGANLSLSAVEKQEERYLRLSIPMNVNVKNFSERQPAFLLCRQILRDIGEACHAHACGISINERIEITFLRYGTI